MSNHVKFAWLTDIHINFLEKEARENFYDSIVATQSEAILITGDIAEADSVSSLLKEMAAYLQKLIYFVLGNHDYYRGQVDNVRQNMISLTHTEEFLYWLPALGGKFLEGDTLLIGQDGWADGRYGNYADSQVILNDSLVIADLFQQKIMGKFLLLKKMQQLADLDANKLYRNLKQAIKQYELKRIIVLTHIPPFKEACLYEGKVSSDDYLPFFSSKATGDVLLKIATAHPNIEFITLCGHTHNEARYQPLDNLIVKVGGAEYYEPIVQEIIC